MELTMKRVAMAVLPVVVVVTVVTLLAMSVAVFAKGEGRFSISSPAFTAKGKIPAKFGCGPERNWRKPSVPLTWSNPPAGTKSFVLLMDDPHPVAKFWVHWLVTDIPASATELLENADKTGLPPEAKQLANSFGDTAYGGPCPPKGSHTYRFRLYAMPSTCTKLDTTNKRGNVLGPELAETALGTATITAEYP